jgi:undecaprenyl pyrophosphate synthase
MDFTTAYFEVVNWPDFREGTLARLYGDRQKSVCDH